MTKTLRVTIDESLHKQLKIVACQTDITMNHAVIKGIEIFINNNKNNACI